MAKWKHFWSDAFILFNFIGQNFFYADATAYAHDGKGR